MNQSFMIFGLQKYKNNNNKIGIHNIKSNKYSPY